MGPLMVVLIVLALLFVVWYMLYIGIVTRKNSVKEAIAGVDVQLTRRYELVPEILAIAKRYLNHEEKLLAEITELRTQVGSLQNLNVKDLKQNLEAGQMLDKKMNNLFAVMENYPDLKADGPMIKAMDVYQDTEDNIAAARRFYNSAVKEFNNYVEIFPGSLVASMLRLSSYPFFTASEEATKKISAKDHL